MSFMIYYPYDDFRRDVAALVPLLHPFAPDTLLAVARGGLTLTHALGMALNIRNLQSIRAESYDDTFQREEVTLSGKCDLSASKRVLVVDDIVDSGKTLAALMPLLRSAHPGIDFKSVALFTKSSALVQPDFSLHEAHDWIDFFWERDYLKTDSL